MKNIFQTVSDEKPRKQISLIVPTKLPSRPSQRPDLALHYGSGHSRRDLELLENCGVVNDAEIKIFPQERLKDGLSPVIRTGTHPLYTSHYFNTLWKLRVAHIWYLIQVFEIHPSLAQIQNDRLGWKLRHYLVHTSGNMVISNQSIVTKIKSRCLQKIFLQF